VDHKARDNNSNKSGESKPPYDKHRKTVQTNEQTIPKTERTQT
jgi:hypothetical protein